MGTDRTGESARLGISGSLAARFLQTEITPLLALVGLLLGFFAIAVTPREEEPQIDVTFANVFIAYPGAPAAEVEQLVSTPMERILSEIQGVEHIYSVSRPGQSVLTVQFEVGEPRDEAIVRLYNAVYSNQDWMPPNIGVLPALNFHLLGVTAITLMFGWAYAVFAVLMVCAGSLINQGGEWQSLGLESGYPR